MGDWIVMHAIPGLPAHHVDDLDDMHLTTAIVQLFRRGESGTYPLGRVWIEDGYGVPHYCATMTEHGLDGGRSIWN